MNKEQLRTITVGELKELLSHYEDDQLVITSHDYGDHCHTEAVGLLNGEIQEVSLYKTAYSESGLGVASDERIDREWGTDFDNVLLMK